MPELPAARMNSGHNAVCCLRPCSSRHSQPRIRARPSRVPETPLLRTPSPITLWPALATRNMDITSACHPFRNEKPRAGPWRTDRPTSSPHSLPPSSPAACEARQGGLWTSNASIFRSPVAVLDFALIDCRGGRGDEGALLPVHIVYLCACVVRVLLRVLWNSHVLTVYDCRLYFTFASCIRCRQLANSYAQLTAARR